MNYTDPNNDDWINFGIDDPSDIMSSMGSISHSSTPVPGINPPATMEHQHQQPHPRQHQQQPHQQHQHQHQQHQQHGSSSSVMDSPQLMPSLQSQQQPVIKQPQIPRRSSNNVLSPHLRSSSASRVSGLRPVSDMQRNAFIQQFSNMGERFTGLEARLSHSDAVVASLAEDLKQMVVYLQSFEQLFEQLGMKPRGSELSGTTPAS